jgi:tetratricopeptide (TPR) repeat protein
MGLWVFHNFYKQNTSQQLICAAFKGFSFFRECRMKTGSILVLLLCAAAGGFAQTDDAGAYACNNRGVYCIESGILDEAIEAFTEAIRLKADFAEAYYNRGIVWYYKKDYARARADWEKTLQIDPDHAGARQNLELPERLGR